MTSQNGFRSYILELIAEKRAKKASIQASVQKQLDECDFNIAALETTLTIHDESNPITPEQHKIAISPRKLRENAKTQSEALKYIARHTDGTVCYNDARDLIIAAKMTHGKAQNVASHIYKIMANSDEWERVAPGVFRLVNKSRIVNKGKILV